MTDRDDQEQTAAAAQLGELGQRLGRSDLRRSLRTSYAAETLDAYRRRFQHYQQWCTDRGYQRGPENINGAVLLEYIGEHVAAFATFLQQHQDDLADPSVELELPEQLLRPNTLQVAINALIYYGERAGIAVLNDREAKELVRDYRDAWNAAGIPPAYRVAGRRSPRQRRT